MSKRLQKASTKARESTSGEGSPVHMGPGKTSKRRRSLPKSGGKGVGAKRTGPIGKRVGSSDYGDAPQNTPSIPHTSFPADALSPSDTQMPLPPEDASITHYRGTSLVNVGRDPATGRVIPHQRSEKTAQLISIWVAGGYNVNDIAIRLNVRPGLIKEHYGVELNHGDTKVGMEMTETIVSRAKESDRMAIFFAKARMGWRDGERNDVAGDGLLAIHIHV